MAAPLASAFRRDEHMVGNWVSLPEPAIAELFASMDFDFVIVDMEHTTATVARLLEMVRSIDAAPGDTRSIVRVPGADAALIKRVLDLGIDGIMLPMVQTVEQAESFVEACRYPPDGSRGVGPGRGAGYGLSLPEQIEADDGAFATIVQIESERAIGNAREIAAVDGVDALFVGPTDLSVSMGTFGEDEGRLFGRIEGAVDDVAAAGTPVGTVAIGANQIERCADIGFDFLAVGYDAHFLIEGSKRARATYESERDR
jgi:2-keto-3-deoxy-L-rhamnonate aldolase RhmA